MKIDWVEWRDYFDLRSAESLEEILKLWRCPPVSVYFLRIFHLSNRLCCLGVHFGLRCKLLVFVTCYLCSFSLFSEFMGVNNGNWYF